MKLLMNLLHELRLACEAIMLGYLISWVFLGTWLAILEIAAVDVCETRTEGDPKRGSIYRTWRKFVWWGREHPFRLALLSLAILVLLSILI